MAAITHYRSAGAPLARQVRHIIDIMTGIRRTFGRPPKKEAVLDADLLDMMATLPNDVPGWRHRAV